LEAAEWIVVVGIGATLVMDLWGVLQRRLLGVATLDYALVGRWLGQMRHGRIRHDSILKAPPVCGEAAFGWAAHYAIGIAFAGLLLAAGGSGWARDPSPGLALAVGLLTVAAPLLVMQPAMGFGVAASRLPKPWTARGRSMLNHLVFGAGLYLAALLTGPLTP
jgi:hypothetical protein